MEVLQVSETDYGRGGGTIVMERLQKGLIRSGVGCRILCGSKLLDSPLSVQIPRRRVPEGILRRLLSVSGLDHIHYVRSFGISKMPAFREADVLHIHGIHGGFFSYLALPALTRQKPGVFTLHDMWAFTGHCTYSSDCRRWESGCGSCPYPDAWPPVKQDITGWEWKLKKWAFNRSNLTIVVPSLWMMEQAKRSLLGNLPIRYIPNGIDTREYHPFDREQCRRMLGIEPGRKVIMFTAMRLDLSDYSGYRKGGDLLVKALNLLPKSLKSETVLLLLGSMGASLAQASGIEANYLGYIESDRLKAIAYSAADLFIQPTREDNAPLTLLEAMACGTPMVSFRVGGVPELARPDVTGYLAEPEDFEGLSRGMARLLEDNDLRAQMSRNCREIALKEFDLQLHVDRHIELYRQLSGN